MLEIRMAFDMEVRATVEESSGIDDASEKEDTVSTLEACDGLSTRGFFRGGEAFMI